MVKAHAGILETDSAKVATDKLDLSVRTALGDDRDADWVVRRLQPLVGLGSDQELSQDQRSESFAAWRRFFEALAERSPLVLVFEDLQWADEGLLDFVDYLVEWVSDLPIFVVATARPELLERRPAWGGGKVNAATVQLQALSEDDTARLVSALLEQAVLPAETQAVLLARAGGNPLYAQEFIRMLVDRRYLRRDGSAWTLDEGESLPLPESVQGVIAARLDALPQEEKELLQDASVLGKVIWEGALAAISKLPRPVVEERLHALRRKEFIRGERHSSVAGETQYSFLHLLMRDVAYGQIPRAARAERHRLAAEWLESLPADRAEDRAEMLAHHYLSALEFGRSAGQDVSSLATPARLALREAGERAFGLIAFGQAGRFFSAALELWPEDDPDRPRLLLRLAYTRSYGRAMDESFFEARDALLAAGEHELAAEAEVLIGRTAWEQGDQDLAFTHLRRAHELVRDAPASYSKALVLHWLARSLALADQIDEAISLGRETIEMAEILGLDELRANALTTIGFSRFTTGDLGRLEDEEQSIEIARAIKSPDVVRSLGNYASCLKDLGEIGRAGEIVEEARAEAVRLGRGIYIAWLDAERIIYAYYAGRWDDALEIAEQMVAEFETSGSPSFMEPAVRAFRAQILLARDDPETALAETASRSSSHAVRRIPRCCIPRSARSRWSGHGSGFSTRPLQAADELLEDWSGARMLGTAEWLLDLACVLVPHGRADDLEQALSRVTLDLPWVVAARAYAAGDAAAAAEVFGAMRRPAGRGPDASTVGNRQRGAQGDRLLPFGRRDSVRARGRSNAGGDSMSVREERKVVTVLFCDLVGFTSRSEESDPEDVAAVLRGYHGHVRSELERFAGTVEKFIGDAVMALFGAPIAHEDDPERAVRAALAIRDWAEQEAELEVRIGITTGEALVSLDARPESGQGMASGDVVNTAARLQAAAAVNGILVDQTTYRATERAIVFEEAEAVEAKGKRRPRAGLQCGRDERAVRRGHHLRRRDAARRPCA